MGSGKDRQGDVYRNIRRPKMKKTLVFFGIVLILSTSLFLLAQKANKQAWRDFRIIIRAIETTEGQIQQLHNYIVGIESEKAEIIDDTARRNELIKILDVHPDYSVQWVQTRITKLTELKQWLEDNGYIQ